MNDPTVAMSDPEDVTIIVHGARGLQGRKSGRHKFSVIFGVGNKKYRTDVVKDPTGCPDFNEETIVPGVNPGDNVFFTVTEKDDILGQLAIPLSSLQSTKGRILRAVLLPHRKCLHPQGELIYQCYVSRYRRQTAIQRLPDAGNDAANDSRNGGFAKLKQSLGTTPILGRKIRKNKRSDTLSIGGTEKHENHKHKPLSGLNKKFSKSLHDLINFARGISDVDEHNENMRKFKATSTNYMDEIGQRPVISAVTPNQGSTSGGTHLVIVGRHMGIEPTDIVTFSLCGCDLRDSLQYESTMRLYCTTKAWPALTGDLIIETTSGGRTVVNAGFSFVDANTAKMSSSSSVHSVTERPTGASNGSAVKNKPPTPAAPTLTVTPPFDASHNTPQTNISIKSPIGRSTSGDESCGSEQMSKTLDSPSKNKYKNKKEGLISRHVRHNSETVTGAIRRDPLHNSWNNEELIAEVNRLELENKALKLENQDMKAYIEKLLNKVMLACPTALENQTVS